MKRMAALAIAVLLAALALVGALPAGLPAGSAESVSAQQADGTVLAVENRRFTSRIYTLKDGVVQGVYEELRLQGGQESRIARAAAADQAYFLRTLSGGAAWELLSLENGRAQLLRQGRSGVEGTVTGFQMKDGTAWVTTVDDTHVIRISRWTEKDGIAVEQVIPSDWLRDAVTAEYDGTVLRATTAHGDSAFVSRSGSVSYSQQAAETPAPEIVVTGSGWLLCKRAALLVTLAAVLLVLLALTAVYAVCRRAKRLAVKVTTTGGVLLLLAGVAGTGIVFFALSDDLAEARRAATWVGLLLALVWVAATAILWGLASRMTAPLRRMTEQMDRVAEGDAKAQEETCEGEDELARMDHAIQMLCMSLSVWSYESVNTIRSYKRFVPEKMAELLERPVAEEIRLGDSRRMTGNVGVFSIGNRAEARNTLEDAGFVDFINRSFGVFHDCVAENHGCMLSGGLRLSAMEALFTGSAADGLRAGLDFIGKLQACGSDALPAPDGCVLLHQASFLYGIAGQEQQLFPYLSSSELDFLGGYLPAFYQAGVPVVTTEAYWKQLEGLGFTGRYLGYVNGGERLGSYKLYEVLDAYPELERELRKGYDPRFQEAVNLFYRNDFYLARNLFSTLVRACPSDGIARWYLFACEYFFHQEGTDEVDHQLFGLKEMDV